MLGRWVAERCASGLGCNRSASFLGPACVGQVLVQIMSAIRAEGDHDDRHGSTRSLQGAAF
jgi:hypothetical protein